MEVWKLSPGFATLLPLLLALSATLPAAEFTYDRQGRGETRHGSLAMTALAEQW